MSSTNPTQLTLYAVKQSQLTTAEVDQNFLNLQQTADAAQTSDQVALAIANNSNLGNLQTPVQNAITAAVTAMAQQLTAALSSPNPANITGFKDGSGPVMNLPDFLAYILQVARSGGAVTPPSAPVIITNPYLLFGPSATVTITNASPMVVTWTGHGKPAGSPVQFASTGSLPAPLVAGKVYYVLAAGLATNTFEIGLTAGGAAINGTGAGSGTHTGWSSADVNDAPVYRSGTYSGTTVTTRDLQLTQNGTVIQTITNVADGQTLPNLAASFGNANVGIVELANYGQAVPVSNPSASYPVAAVAGVPAVITAASLTPTANGYLLSVGSWTNTPTGYIKQILNNTNTVVLALTDATTSLLLPTASAPPGASLTARVVATNAASGVGGTGVTPSVSTPPLIVPGGQVPSYTGVASDGTRPVPPGFDPQAVYQVGIPMTRNFGAALYNPDANGYSWQDYLNGNPYGNPFLKPQATGQVFNVPQAGEWSMLVTPSNATGAGAPYMTASVRVAAAAGGGGGGASTFVDISSMGTNSAASGTIAPPGLIQSGDLLLLTASNNGPQSWSTPTGSWTIDDVLQFLTTYGEEAGTWVKFATGSEPASYTLTPAAAEIFGAILVAYRGVVTGIVAHNENKSDSANSNTPSPVWLTVPYTDQQRVVLIGVLDCNASCSATWTKPDSTWSLRGQVDFLGASGQWASIVVMDKLMSGSGNTGSIAASATLSGGALANWMTFTKVIA